MSAQIQVPVQIIQQRSGLPISGIKPTIELLESGATIPFISRYRKEATGSLDEVAITTIKNEYESLTRLMERKQFILDKIEEQDKLTDNLRGQIESCWEETRLEDLYLPYKKKAKTKATVARDKGLEPLARIIMAQRTSSLEKEARQFLSKDVSTVEEALEGARHIIAEWVSENTRVRDQVRKVFRRTARLVSKVVKKKKEDAATYTDYFDFSEPLSRCPSHRLLAIYRGEAEGYLRVKLDIDEEAAKSQVYRQYLKGRNACAPHIKDAIDDSLKRLVFPSIENEFRSAAKDRADEEAISVFAENLSQLLLAPPLGSKRILAIDPGFRTGCKVVCLDEKGDLIKYGTIFPHPPQNQTDKAGSYLTDLARQYDIEAIAIGNGTAGRETMAFCKSLNFKKSPELFLVNESGASIYSASEVAREEFPDLDLTVRGAISIGRRLMDPLAELVKIDPKSIGVGQYQHDVNQSKLRESLDRTVESCVNAVGINLNTASKHLLSYVSGLGPGLSQNIVEYRTAKGPFSTRSELLEVPRLGQKAFEQAAGFLRIRDGKNPLDNTAVHPESYHVVEAIAKDRNQSIDDLLGEKDLGKKIDLQDYITDQTGLPTLKDILRELEKPGLDIRGKAESFHFTEGLNSMDDLQPGMIVPGIVNNITKFGAFIDIGIKESGLVHISQIADRFIKDPAEVLKLNQKVRVKVMEVDLERKRISLSIKEAGSFT